ncbi:MAG TPA: 5-formyltetrahydrofolate cyclo-ligase, partial [Chthoniobacterales bacterium]
MTVSDRTSTDKAALRARLLDLLRALPAEERADRSARICRRIVESEHWMKAERVLLFSPMRTEPDVSCLSNATQNHSKL